MSLMGRDRTGAFALGGAISRGMSFCGFAVFTHRAQITNPPSAAHCSSALRGHGPFVGNHQDASRGVISSRSDWRESN